MSLSLVSSTLILMAVVAAQPSAERPLSAEEVARLEAKHLQNIRQVTYGFFRAGEGYFRPDGKAIIFQAVPNLPTSVFLSAKPNQYEYQIFTCDLAPDAKPLLVSTGLGACTCAFFHPDGKSIIFGSTHLNPSPRAPRTAYSRSGSRYRWSFPVGVHRCSCGYPPSPRGGPALWETLKVATFAIPQSHSVDCKAERVRPGRCGNDTPIVPSASWRRSKTVTRNGRRTSPRRRGTSRLTAGTSGVRCCASKTPVGISRLYLCAARRHTPEL